MKTYFIPVQTVKDYSYLDDNIEDKTIKVCLDDVQRLVLEPILGTDFYNDLLNKVTNSNLNAAEQDFIVEYLWPILIKGVNAKIGMKLLFRYTNSAVTSDDNANSRAVDIKNLNSNNKELESEMKGYIDRCITYLQANMSSWSLYTSANVGGIEAQTQEQNMDFYVGDEYGTPVYNPLDLKKTLGE